MKLGTTELIIIFAIVILLFGVGRISNIAGELGKGIKAFRQGISDSSEEKEKAAAKKIEEEETTQE